MHIDRIQRYERGYLARLILFENPSVEDHLALQGLALQQSLDLRIPGRIDEGWQMLQSEVQRIERDGGVQIVEDIVNVPGFGILLFEQIDQLVHIAGKFLRRCGLPVARCQLEDNLVLELDVAEGKVVLHTAAWQQFHDVLFEVNTDSEEKENRCRQPENHVQKCPAPAEKVV